MCQLVEHAGLFYTYGKLFCLLCNNIEFDMLLGEVGNHEVFLCWIKKPSYLLPCRYPTNWENLFSAITIGCQD